MRFALLVLLAVFGCGGGYGSSSGSGGYGMGGGGGGTQLDITWSMGRTGLSNTVAVGTTVVWHSGDGATHTVTSSAAPAAFTEISVPGGGTGSMKFTTAGTYAYYCRIHGAGSMNGTLIVQ